jgi:hypothetical protein
MLFKSSTTASLLALCALSSAASLKHKRATKSGVTLYAYGENANGGPVFYADGKSYHHLDERKQLTFIFRTCIHWNNWIPNLG